MKPEEILSRSPDILGGETVFAGTRVPAQTLLDYLEAGDRIDDFLDDFPTVTREQVSGFLRLAGERVMSQAGARPAR